MSLGELKSSAVFFSSPLSYFTQKRLVEKSRQVIPPCSVSVSFSHADNAFSIGWRYLFLSVLAVTAAMLCKEQGITICGICAVYEIFVVQKVIKKVPLYKKKS